MKILIIDNGSSYLNKIKETISETSFDVEPFSNIDLEKIKNYDGVILSGGHDFPVVGNENKLADEIELIKNINKPILGICFGFELIAHIYKSELTRSKEKEKGILDLEILQNDPIFNNLSNLKVYESHRWIVRNVGEDLLALAKSEDGIEVIKHKYRPIYGVQFHPEMFADYTCGQTIIKNFLDQI